MWSFESNYQKAQQNIDVDKKEDTMSINVTQECK